ncbi:hypothetical protein CONLIGDRAFT_311414 [Coniochaeta ligniaria NRRL 30616]|uniref:Uncharacterized protein n=1 Tax=Coniochaeta ligniaria NRRL 30616 TaxID=1408157 RepID=A0A1J7IVI7_9PEZI|nr:hypothetical protein CONLIGDRAFT_311414 [Coniochaeta ligniaria NRRL 30616]
MTYSSSGSGDSLILGITASHNGVTQPFCKKQTMCYIEKDGRQDKDAEFGSNDPTAKPTAKHGACGNLTQWKLQFVNKLELRRLCVLPLLSVTTPAMEGRYVALQRRVVKSTWTRPDGRNGNAYSSRISPPGCCTSDHTRRLIRRPRPRYTTAASSLLL